jgi:transketolase
MGPHDKLILSKGHAAPALYATLAEVGLIDVAELSTLRQPHSRLQGHPDRVALPHVHAGTGALGQGLSMAIGYALAAKLDGSNGSVYCIVGDGELQEGQCWEAAMAATKFGLDNLCMIIDNNRFQNEVSTSETMDADFIAALEAFGWVGCVANTGHSVEELCKCFGKFTSPEEPRGAPFVVIAHTVKGEGVSFMEDENEWHSKQMTDEQYQEAMKELK